MKVMADKELLLDLSTDKYIANIKIDGVNYGLINAGKLSLLERQKMTTFGSQLANAGKLKTIKDEEKYQGILLRILNIIIPDAAKRQILYKLSITDMLDIVNAYMEVSGLTKKKVTRLAKGAKAKRKNR